MENSGTASRRGLTLVEVLLVIGIMGCLLAILLPAVQAARESARLTKCADNLRNIGLALANYHTAQQAFPVGSDLLRGTEHAWSSRILPFVEFAAVFQQIDYALPWNAPGGNLTASIIDVPLYVCPSSLVVVAGKQDYGGIMGTGLASLPAGMGPNNAFGCGVLIVSSRQQPQPVRAAQITDGLTYTMCVGESVDRDDSQAGLWASGWNCYSQNEPRIDMDDIGSLHSLHPAGAQALFADGHVRVVTDQIAGSLLGAMCTRNGGESDVSAAFSD